MARRSHAIRWTAAGLVALAALGCQRAQQASVTDTTGGAPQAPVGPIPGPSVAQAEQPGPYSGNVVAMQEGRKLFVRYNCSGCHGGRAGGGMGPSLRDEDWMYGGSDADVFDSISQGRAHGMPAWGTRIPADQMWKLVAYVRSLRTPEEPDAPTQPAEPEEPRSQASIPTAHETGARTTDDARAR